MYKLKWVYICDICGNVGLPRDVLDNMDGVMKVPPKGWKGFSKVHICSHCAGKAKKEFEGDCI